MEDLYMSSGADFGVGGHRYNDDLLLAAAPRERAQREFPRCFHILDHPELREVFRPTNDAANRAKLRSHVGGFWAVVCAFVALIGAASEPFWGHLPGPWPRVIAVTTAALGLFSFFVSAIWLLFGKRKKEWLHARFHTERLRQFHFQSFIWRIADIAESLRAEPNSKDNYRHKRDHWFNAFEDEISAKGDGQMSALLQAAPGLEIWLHANVPVDEGPPDVEGLDLDDVFRAYETLRFNEQLGYAEYVLRLNNQPIPERVSTTKKKFNLMWFPGMRFPLQVQRRLLNIAWVLALGGLVVTHLVVLGSHFTGSPFEGAAPHVIIVGAALTAVAVKTLSEGFALTREIERYKEYHSVVSSLRQAFRSAETSRQKLRIMIEMERSSFEEMRIFIRSHHEATFIM